MLTHNNISWIICNLPFYAEQPKEYTIDWKHAISVEERFEDLWTKEFDQLYPEVIAKVGSSMDWNWQLLDEKTYDIFNNFWNNHFIPHHPEVNEWLTIENDQYLKEELEFNQAEKERCDKIISFCGQKLNQPGTLIELQDGTIHLIGTVTPTGCIIEGESDFGNVKQIPRDAIVIRYCHLLYVN